MNCRVIAWSSLFLMLFSMSTRTSADDVRTVEIPLGAAGEVPVAEIVARLARASGITIERPPAGLTLSTRGISRGLTKALLTEALGPGVDIIFSPRAVILKVDPGVLSPARRAKWTRRLRGLADRASEAAKRRENYGMHALPSYRPNDPSRPTICMVHGLNSSSGGFVYVIPWLEEAGYGIVIYDYPFNQPIGESCAAFARDWAAFRKKTGDGQSWAIFAHSMGALLARSLVEDDATWAGDVSSLIMIAPVNQGSNLARVQTVVQLLNGLQSINEKKTSRAMLHLADGTGQSARDMLPGNPFLKKLNRRPRRAGVAYHIIAGDRGLLTPEARVRIETQLGLTSRNAGLFGQLAQAANTNLSGVLDELTDGTGDGAVSIAHTRLDGVDDHVVIHANHAELIRAPLLFSEPGPVACMPDVLRRLRADRERERK